MHTIIKLSPISALLIIPGLNCSNFNVHKFQKDMGPSFSLSGRLQRMI